MGSAVMQEQVQCTMGVGASTLGDVARVNLTAGCAMGDATLGDVGCTFGASGGFCGRRAGGIESMWMGVGGRCWRGVLVGQCAAVWRSGRVTVGMVHGSFHQLKRLGRVDIAWSWALLEVKGALVMALEIALRLCTMVSAGVTVGMVR
jgi:hypothetical protein